MTFDYDVIVIGSGFGGSVTAARMAEAGKRVLVLERGRRWEPEDFPRGPGDAWFYDVDKPQSHNGWLDLRWFGAMSVAMGAGVGGGSLIYGNVSIVPPPATFERHWPAEIRYEDLLPFFHTVGEMLGVQEMPENQVPPRYHAARKGAEALGVADRFQRVPLAVSFDDDWRYEQDSPHDADKSKPFINAFGRQQGTCTHCGFCCAGCPVKAKNTLDLNYLAQAEDLGAEIRPLHLVDNIKPFMDGYMVNFRRLENGDAIPGSVSARRVVLAAGSLGSTEILLRSRDEAKTLPGLSGRLGEGWSSNGDFLTFSVHKEVMNITRGPTISCAIDLLDGSYDGARIFVEDGALGDIPNTYMTEAVKQARRWFHFKWYVSLTSRLLRWLKRHPTVPHVIAWFAQSVDASNGRLALRRPWYAPWRRRLHIHWEVSDSEETFNAVHRLHTELAKANDATRVMVPPTWSLLRDLTTPHPLGGCRMADNREEGVVDHRGEVFGYPGLYVADGSVIPFALGINPSRTIAALAERMCSLMLDEERVLAQALKMPPATESRPQDNADWRAGLQPEPSRFAYRAKTPETECAIVPARSFHGEYDEQQAPATLPSQQDDRWHHGWAGRALRS